MAEYIERGGKLFPTPFSSEEHGDYRQGWNHCLRAIYQMPAADVITWAELKGLMVDKFKSRLAAGYTPTWNDAMEVVDELRPNGGQDDV